MPANLKKEVDEAVKEGNYATVSEFFRDAIRTWKEEQLYQSVIKSRLEISQGKGKILRSLKDLM